MGNDRLWYKVKKEIINKNPNIEEEKNALEIEIWIVEKKNKVLFSLLELDVTGECLFLPHSSVFMSLKTINEWFTISSN